MPNSQSGKPSLDDAFARIRRARQHIGNLKRRSRTVLDSAATFQFRPNAPDPIICILAGEALYSQRAALDYLIYELAILDSGQIQQNTQFPIEDWPKKLKGTRQDFLKDWVAGPHSRMTGVSAIHKAVIMEYQPFRGCQWTRSFQELSNPDKHRHFNVTKLSGSWTNSDTHTNSPISGESVKVNLNFAGHIAFDDGSPVIETLEVLQREIAAVLDMFRGEF